VLNKKGSLFVPSSTSLLTCKWKKRRKFTLASLIPQREKERESKK
jgi:hypothetical protein